MVTLEQVRLLEEKVSRAIEYVTRTAQENTRLASENSRLTGRVDACQKRIDELEVMVQRFKDDQSRIEDGILSALDRLNQFEDAIETPSEITTVPEAPEEEESGKTSPGVSFDLDDEEAAEDAPETGASADQDLAIF